MFIKRGVEFLVFPDESFDFYTQLNRTQGDTYYKRNKTIKHRSTNTMFGTPLTNVTYSNPRNKDTIVTHDKDGIVRSIGYVFLNYNRIGQIKRVVLSLYILAISVKV